MMPRSSCHRATSFCRRAGFSCRRAGFTCDRGRFCPPLPFVFLALSGILAVLGSSRPAAGQAGGRAAMGGMGGMGDRTVPTKSYHAAFADFYDGDYRSALERFKAESRGAIKGPQSRWIDSICYETMQGECYYQMGVYPDALAHYTAALELFQAYPTWLAQVVFQPMRADTSMRKPPPWQVRRLQAPLGQLPYTMLLGHGQVDASSAVKQGGVYAAAQPVSHRAARDPPLHDAGHPPPRRVAGTAGRPRSANRQRHRRFATPARTAQPLVGSVDQPGVGAGPVGRPAERPWPFPSCKRRRSPRASSSIR